MKLTSDWKDVDLLKGGVSPIVSEMYPFFYQYRLKQIALTLTILITIIFAGIECASGAPPEEQWNKTINGTIGRGVSIIRQTSDNGCILGGATFPATFHVDFWLMKIDPEGQEQWNMTYGGAGYE